MGYSTLCLSCVIMLLSADIKLLIHPTYGISFQNRLSRTVSFACVSGHTRQGLMHLAGILPPATFCIINVIRTTSKEEQMFSLSECSLQREEYFRTESQEYCYSVQMFSCFIFIPIGGFLKNTLHGTRLKKLQILSSRKKKPKPKHLNIWIQTLQWITLLVNSSGGSKCIIKCWVLPSITTHSKWNLRDFPSKSSCPWIWSKTTKWRWWKDIHSDKLQDTAAVKSKLQRPCKAAHKLKRRCHLNREICFMTVFLHIHYY